MAHKWGREWWGAPFALLFFIGVSLLATAGPSRYVAIISLGFGFALGWALRMPRPFTAWLALGYGALVVLLAFAVGRTVPVAVATGVSMAVSLATLTLLGRALRLRDLRTPSDALRLFLLAAATGLLLPLLTLLNARILDFTAVAGRVTPQSVLTGVIGVIVAGGLVLTYAPGSLRLAPWRLAELFAVTAVVLFLLLGVSLMDAHSLAGAGPLFVLLLSLGWLAIRFGPYLASCGSVLVTCWIALGVAQGTSVFTSATTNMLDAVVAAQLYLSVLGASVIMLAVYAAHTRDQDAAARHSADMLANALEGASAELFVKRYDADLDRYVYVEVNDALARSSGVAPDDLLGRSAEELYGPDLAATFRAQDDEVMHGGRRREYRISSVINGHLVHYSTLMFPITDEAGTPVGVGGICVDRTEEHRREQLLHLVFAQSPVATARVSVADGRVLEANDAFRSMVGLDPQSLEGRPLADLMPGYDGGVAEGGTARRELRLHRADGADLTVVMTATLVAGEETEERFVLVILEDVTAARAAEAGLVHRATHDLLTDLLNRQALVERMAAHTDQGLVPPGVAVLCCDLDDFKQINDSHGHDTGDWVLLSIAERLRRAVDPQDTLARLGADEFVVVAAQHMTAASAEALGERVREALAAPLEIDGRTHTIHTSIGVVVSAGDSGPEDLLRQADVALTRAKDLGRDRTEVYRPELDQRVRLRVAMRDTLRTALSENRVDVHAQPVIDAQTGRIVGAEALVRVRDLDGTLLPPAAFIPVAEESGLIVPLGLRVLDVALALRARWAEAGSQLEIAVNVSPRQLADRDFPQTIVTLLQAHGVPAGQLVLEVTESTVVDAAGTVLDVIAGIRALGVHVAIDDFGTGYSSLTVLRDLPADVVKIDRSFVAGMLDDEGDEAIVRAVLAMAHATHRTVVAEGVESAAQAARLRALGCDRLQGFHYSRPLAPTDFDPARHYGVDGAIPQPRLQG